MKPYFEEEEQYMSEMTNAQMEDEYNRLAAAQAEVEAEVEQQRLIDEQFNERNNAEDSNN